MDMRCIALLACGLALLAPRTLAQTCPPPFFDSARNLDFAKYISAPWFIQMQEATSFQPEERLHCVVAQYKLRGRTLEEGVEYAYHDCTGVNTGCRFTGTINGVVNSRALVGYPDRSLSVPATRASKLRVAPGFLEPLRRIPGVFGQYWVVAFEPTNYDWAIVSPGPPEIKSNGACRTGDPALRRFQRLGTGLWLFTRKAVDPASTAVMLQKLKDLGYDTSFLLPVQHTGCTYTSAVGVPRPIIG